MSKKIYHYRDIKDKIIRAIDMIADPVVQTLSPKGGNVIYEDKNGDQFVTNDGVTIARNIILDDPIENAIINIIKHASLRTNSEAGDGTTTSILLSQNLIKGGLKLIDEGWNPIELKKEFEKFGTQLKSNLHKIEVKNDKDLLNIATISSNNDTVIAQDVVKVVKSAGENGMIFIEPNNKLETEIVEDLGFNIPSGMLIPEMRNSSTNISATYQNVAMLITDKRIYYPEEAETIIKSAIEAGYKNLVVVARDFIGKSVDLFVTNHVRGVINLLLVRHPDCVEGNNDVLQDLAVYTNGKLISEKLGKIVNKILPEDFVIVSKVYSDVGKTIITPKSNVNEELTMRVSALKGELAKNKENKTLQKRLSSLTSGLVTIKVGGSTPIEVQEKMFRYEDAVNATRSAAKDGYLIGGGVSLLKAFDPSKYKPELVSTFKKYCEASLRQIAINCGKHVETIIDTVKANKNPKWGYNALTDTFEDLSKAGVVDPYKVTTLAIDNSISVANVIISSNYLIVNDNDKQRNGESKDSAGNTGGSKRN